ncbi:578_t:CDS:2 [Funneliformis caledonium]|uniref:578_t:CDS:1 n=1 Tax=Funneliformis caledonium TaxID=1117310 RepID=A0A9N9G2D0_9GLOM|nr:578_t:CDS:2 [Funneliformis caledonium]
MSSTSLSRSDSGSSKYSTPPQTPSTTPPPFIMYLNMNTSTILEVMIAADELCLQEIIDYAQNYLLLYKPGWIQRNFATTYKIATVHNSFNKLLEYCNEIIVNDPELVLCSDDFCLLEENALLTLLKRDDLLIDELTLWDYLINWGITSTGLSRNLSEWTNKDYEILSEKVEKCLPSIRFLHISSGDFYKRIKPFAPIIPVELYEDILQYHLVPEHQPSENLIQPKRVTIDSVIIERKHAALIANWIDGKDCETEKENCLNNPYEFKLLHRGSRDGFTGIEFHQKCNSKCATVSIMKISNTGELIGGFTPISCRVKDPSRAINYYKNYGPSFGGNDLKLAGNFKIDTKCHCRQEDYENPIRNDPSSFNIDEYEVFQIIPRRPDLMNL